MLVKLPSAPGRNFGEITSERTLRFFRASHERALRHQAGGEQAFRSRKEENWTRAFFELYASEPLRRRQALAFAYALVNEPVHLFDDERLVGQFYLAVPGGSPVDMYGSQASRCPADSALRWEGFDSGSNILRRLRGELPEFLEYFELSLLSPGHVGWHWDWILAQGIEGLLERIAATEPAADATGREVLEGMRLSLQAVLDFSDRHLAELEKRLAGAGPAEAAELRENVELCRRVPRRGARTFREAVQAFHFSYSCTYFENTHGGNGPGRLDYYLWPYLSRDLAAERITLAEARELIDELFIRIHESWGYERDGGVATIVVGGCDREGRSALNPLSRIMVESIAALGITHPSVYIRLPEEADDAAYELAAQDICWGGNRAQILNDRAIIAAVGRDGHIPVEDARMYMCGGCMELSPHGMNGDLLFTNFINALKVFELVLTGGQCPPAPAGSFGDYHPAPGRLRRNLTEFPDFESFFSAWVEELTWVLRLNFRAMDINAQEFARWRPRFLLSSQVEDCIGRGRVINQGGAKYEDFGCTPLGLPNIADSLTAIKLAVFEQKFVTAPELLAALRADFVGYEALHQRLLALPKYGQGDPAADAMANRVVDAVCAIYEGYVNCLGGKVKPMVMTFMMAPVAGAAVGATPDGRRAGRPIAQSVTPQACALARQGITAGLLSANSLELPRFSGGAATMWDLDKKLAKLEVVKSLLRTFVATGGQMFQGNVTAVEELRHAQVRPEEYGHLMVRVGGYSGRFVTLGEALQTEVIERHRHAG